MKSMSIAPGARIATLLALLYAGAAPAADAPQPPPAPPQVTVANNPEQIDPHEGIKKITLPAGFRIEVYADNVTGARTMALSPNGTLFVGTFTVFGQKPYGKVYALRDENGDHVADKVYEIAHGLDHPNGVAFRNGSLYVAELSRITRYDDIEAHLDNPPAPKVIYDKYPKDFFHGWKYLRFGPDDKMYIPVGAPCNICEPKEPYGTITRMNADGTGFEIFARGLRNSQGMDFDPRTGQAWFVDNGRDEWGNDRPPEELNHATAPGQNFGYPYRYGKNIPDDTFKTKMTDADFTPADVEMPAHNAPLGMRFYTGKMFPAQYRNQIFIALHGSWNRNPPDGYRVVLVRMKDGKAQGWEPFATGWLDGDKYWGRPVDVEVMADGSMLVSDDFAGAIYRITYEAPAAAPK